MAMQSMIQVVQAMDDAFKNRTLTHHLSEDRIKVFLEEKQQNVLVFDTCISKKILKSKAFISFNYFKLGIEHLAAKNKPVQAITDVYLENILFKEGDEAHQIKKSLHLLLEKYCKELKGITPRISSFIHKRKKLIHSPLFFSRMFTRLCMGLIVARLTDIPLKRVYDALALRQNVFFTYFHSSRHLALNDVFNCLYNTSTPAKKDQPNWSKHLLAQHLIVMALDPIIAAICANIVDNSKSPSKKSIYQYCPTSFVVRKCVQSILIDDIRFNPEDVCYVSLLPAAPNLRKDSTTCPVSDDNQDHANLTSLAFGLGKHTCIGKHLSLTLLDLAEKIVTTVFSDGFENESVIAPDGAFLAFSDLS